MQCVPWSPPSVPRRGPPRGPGSWVSGFAARSACAAESLTPAPGLQPRETRRERCVSGRRLARRSRAPVAWGPMSPATRRDLALLLLVSGLAFWWQLGRLGLIDPDEPFYAQTATEMLERRDLVTPYLFGHPQFEKPPLYYWLACGSFAALGRNEFAARAPGALFATLLVLMTWVFGRAAFGRRAGLLAGVVLATGAAYALVARLMLTDMVFSALVCAACFAFWRAAGGERPRPAWLVLAAAASALATLAKGPLGILVPALAALAWLGLARRPLPARGRTLLAALAVYLAIAGPWYAAMLSSRGMDYFRAFFI